MHSWIHGGRAGEKAALTRTHSKTLRAHITIAKVRQVLDYARVSAALA
jgi:hypothetical protein